MIKLFTKWYCCYTREFILLLLEMEEKWHFVIRRSIDRLQVNQKDLSFFIYLILRDILLIFKIITHVSFSSNESWYTYHNNCSKASLKFSRNISSFRGKEYTIIADGNFWSLVILFTQVLLNIILNYFF